MIRAYGWGAVCQGSTQWGVAVGLVGSNLATLEHLKWWVSPSTERPHWRGAACEPVEQRAHTHLFDGLHYSSLVIRLSLYTQRYCVIVVGNMVVV